MNPPPPPPPHKWFQLGRQIELGGWSIVQYQLRNQPLIHWSLDQHCKAPMLNDTTYFAHLLPPSAPIRNLSHSIQRQRSFQVTPLLPQGQLETCIRFQVINHSKSYPERRTMNSSLRTADPHAVISSVPTFQEAHMTGFADIATSTLPRLPNSTMSDF